MLSTNSGSLILPQSYARVTEQLSQLLQDQIEAVDLRFYYTQHKVKETSV